MKPFSARELLACVRAQLRLADSRRLSREALRASEERYRALATASSDVVFQMSGDWTVMQPLDGRNLVASNSTAIVGWMEKNLPEFEHARVRAAIDEAVAKQADLRARAPGDPRRRHLRMDALEGGPDPR